MLGDESVAIGGAGGVTWVVESALAMVEVGDSLGLALSVKPGNSFKSKRWTVLGAAFVIAASLLLWTSSADLHCHNPTSMVIELRLWFS
jgi:hypothetical protein